MKLAIVEVDKKSKVKFKISAEEMLLNQFVSKKS